jgi:hypothetical protein
MATTTTTSTLSDRCELCGARNLDKSTDRLRHLRQKHPAYARGVLLRTLGPLVYLAELAILSAIQAPLWVYAMALAATFGMILFGIKRSRTERRRAGTAPGIGAGRLVKEGGLAFLLVIPAVALLVVAVAGR